MGGEIICSRGGVADTIFILLKGGKYPFTFNSVTFVTNYTLGKQTLFDTLVSGHFPSTWKSIRRWTVRRSFQRAVKSVVSLRRSSPNYTQMTKEAFHNERNRLIKIGHHAEMHGKPVRRRSADLAEEQEPAFSVAEMNEAIKREMYVESSAYVDQVRQSMHEDGDHPVETSAPAAAKSEQALALAGSSVTDERMARMEADVHALRTEMQTSNRELHASIDAIRASIDGLAALWIGPAR